MKFLKKLLHGNEKHQSICSVILVAAGSASRMGGINKVMYELDGTPVIIHSLRPFEESRLIEEIVVVARRESMVEIGQLCKSYGISKVSKVLPGGESRMESVQIGLNEVNASADLIAIHDAARPFICREVLEEAVLQAELTGAAAPGIPVKDTIKVTERGLVQSTLQRDTLFAIQTPQVFEASLIKAAISKAVQDGVSLTDDSSAVERLGFSVAVTAGSEENIKLTTQNDLILGEAILSGRNWH
ncbi:MAG: 2-C-methyl-D-erythritol 4-phosphate cytidylyltransferase [Evtepia sp.]|jgi:2-C-methyl-D-erythritol 4-phosphate cytidylyltransferase|nr:2-C-methyl-D-erythritol 4-phosphate cytidylyltransferase [Evtepia sp.]